MRSIRAVALVIISACSGDVAAPAQAKPLGLSDVFVVATIAGSPLPYTVAQFNQTSLAWAADTIRIVANGAHREQRWFLTTVSGQATKSVLILEGTWRQIGTDAVDILSNDQHDEYSGTFTDAGLNVRNASLQYVFTRCAHC